MPIAELRGPCRVRNTTLYERLTAMTNAGHLVRSPDGLPTRHHSLTVHRHLAAIPVVATVFLVPLPALYSKPEAVAGNLSITLHPCSSNW